MKKHKNPTSFQRRLESREYYKRAYLWLTLAIFIILASLATYFFWPKQTQQNNNNQQSTQNETPTPVIPAKTKIQTPSLPVSKNLSVAYAPQAPFSNWTVHEESCEEAAIYMYRSFLESLTYPSDRITDAEADTVFRDMKAWQVREYGKEPDLTMTALGEFTRGYYGFTPTTKKSITAVDIQTAIAEGYPVIVPVMTHSLENSMYGPTSVYHVLLIKGYDATGVFTNDAGVGNGVNKHYDWNILWQAIDAQSAKMGAGREMLYLSK